MHQIEQRKLPNCTKGKINHSINATFQVMPIGKNITDRNDGKIIFVKISESSSREAFIV